MSINLSKQKRNSNCNMKLNVTAHLSKVGREGFLSFLEGFDLAGGQRLEVSLLPLQPGPLSTDLPERRLFLWPPAFTYRHLQNGTIIPFTKLCKRPKAIIRMLKGFFVLTNLLKLPCSSKYLQRHLYFVVIFYYFLPLLI